MGKYRDFLKEKVKDIDPKEVKDIIGLLNSLKNSSGFTARNLGLAFEVLADMFKDEECTKFISFTGNLVATGLRGLIKEVLKRDMFDVVVTTCGALDHDVARTYADYYHGTLYTDDTALKDEEIHRLGNIFIPLKSYGPLIEEKLKTILERMWSNGLRDPSTKELCWEIGKSLGESSFLYWCWSNGIPVFVPAITDGAVGSQIWLFSERKEFSVNILKDQKEISDIVFGSKKLGALIIGGGVSKHHVIWWAQFKGGLSYAVYITTAQEYDGSLSGARTREAITWGKVKHDALHVTVDCDATLAASLLLTALIHLLEKG